MLVSKIVYFLRVNISFDHPNFINNLFTDSNPSLNIDKAIRNS